MHLTGLRARSTEELIHGVLVRDHPYRWLEERRLPETEEWIREQQKRLNDYFAGCGDLDRLLDWVRDYSDVEVIIADYSELPDHAPTLLLSVRIDALAKWAPSRAVNLSILYSLIREKQRETNCD